MLPGEPGSQSDSEGRSAWLADPEVGRSGLEFPEWCLQEEKTGKNISCISVFSVFIEDSDI